MESVTVIDGRLCSSLDVRDRGLAYGHGVFETMRLAQGSLPLWRYHRARLTRGLQVLRIPCDESRLESSIQALISQCPAEGVLKLTVTAGVSGRGYAVSQPLNPTIIAQWAPNPPTSVVSVRLQVCGHRLPINPALAGIKHLNRLDQVIAAAETAAGNQALLLDTGGRVIEALSHNIFVCHGAQWVTPDMSKCGVEGVMRELLLAEIFPKAGIKAVISSFTLDELLAAEEVFICNSIQGVQSVAEVIGKKQYSEHSQTHRVSEILREKYPCFNA